jgi:hypothetical protein
MFIRRINQPRYSDVRRNDMVILANRPGAGGIIAAELLA